MFSTIGIATYFMGKESIVTKSIVGGAMVAWMVTMLTINRLKKKQ